MNLVKPWGLLGLREAVCVAGVGGLCGCCTAPHRKVSSAAHTPWETPEEGTAGPSLGSGEPDPEEAKAELGQVARGGVEEAVFRFQRIGPQPFSVFRAFWPGSC